MFSFVFQLFSVMETLTAQALLKQQDQNWTPDKTLVLCRHKNLDSNAADFNDSFMPD